MTDCVPSLSLVIAARDTVRYVRPCLASLADQVGTRAEVIFADASSDGTAEVVKREFPWVTLLRAAPGTGYGELRAAGLSAARGEIVAFTDVYCRATSDWLARLRDQPWDRYAAVGGVVVPAPRSGAGAWAAFLNEYAPHLPPQRPGEVQILLGNNVGFRRAALEEAGIVGAPEFWKTFAVWRLQERGHRFWMDPSLVVIHERTTSSGDFARNRYLHGRCFAGTRAASDPPSRRLVRAASCPLLPFLFAARQLRALRNHADYRAHWWQSLPMGLVFHAAWALGEFDGYLRGARGACAQLA